jgi:HK97 family phage major capsid protein
VPCWAEKKATWFIAELADLPPSNADTGHVTATAFKIAGATQVSSEMLTDMDPDIASQIGNSIADQIIWSLDTAVLGTTTSNGPSGLLSLASTHVDPGTSVVPRGRICARRWGSDPGVNAGR